MAELILAVRYNSATTAVILIVVHGSNDWLEGAVATPQQIKEALSVYYDAPEYIGEVLGTTEYGDKVILPPNSTTKVLANRYVDGWYITNHDYQGTD